jgi:hypothetical protein
MDGRHTDDRESSQGCIDLLASVRGVWRWVSMHPRDPDILRRLRAEKEGEDGRTLSLSNPKF